MARCPYGAHRLILEENLSCKRCGHDLSLYATLSDLPVVFYNEARRLWDESNYNDAISSLHTALKFKADFPEAHWLLAAIAVRQERLVLAREHLIRAQELGAKVDLQWLAPSNGPKEFGLHPEQGSASFHTKPESHANDQSLTHSIEQQPGESNKPPPPERIVVAKPSRWRRISVTAAAGLLGLVVGLTLANGDKQGGTKIAEPAGRASGESNAVNDRPRLDLVAKSREMLQAVPELSSGDLKITQVGDRALKIVGQLPSAENKSRLEKILRSIPGVEAIDLGSVTTTEIYIVRTGDSLWRLAAAWYGDPFKWPQIATGNALDEHAVLQPGQRLTIPR